jgi:hypothetical protein
MIHVVAIKCLIGLPLLIHIELLWRSRSRSFCVSTQQPCFGHRGYDGFRFVLTINGDFILNLLKHSGNFPYDQV